MSEAFLFSVPSGEPVTTELFHYCIIGQTQFSGKTTLIKRLAEHAVTQGYRVLVFDTKETEPDYAGFGQQIPVCMREAKDSMVLLGLLESIFKRRLTNYFATLSRLVDASDDYDGIIKRAKQAEAKDRDGWLKDAHHTLYKLLEALQQETTKIKTVPVLQLKNGINRMDINTLSIEAQQLVVRNAFEDALTIYKSNLILVIDEAFKFIPQGYSSAATRAIMNLMTQGAKTGLFGWISTQYLAVTDKDPLKACALKFLGTQDHVTEVKHTLDLVPEAHKYKPEDIMKLKLGHWILVRKRPADIRIVYALPLGAPPEAGVSVAQGRTTPEQVRDTYLKKKQKESEEDLGKIEELEKQLAKSENLRKAAIESQNKAIQVNNELELQIKKLTDLTTKQNEELAKLHLVNNFVAPLEVLVKTIVKDSIPIYSPTYTIAPKEPKHIEKLTVKAEEVIAQVKKPEQKILKIGTETIRERILYIIGIERQGNLTTLSEIEKIAKEYGWNNMTANSIAPKAANIAKDEGLLIMEKVEGQVAYRFPTKIKIQGQQGGTQKSATNEAST